MRRTADGLAGEAMAVLSRSCATAIRKLRQRKHRDANGLFLAEGVRVVEELLASDITLEEGLVTDTFTRTERGQALAVALAQRCPVQATSEAQLAKLAATSTPQGVLIVARQPVASWSAIMAQDGRAQPVLVLDAVQDPGNFGALVRSAHAFAATAVIALTGTVDPWNAKAVRAAAGASFRIPILQAGVREATARLREAGYELLGADTLGAPLIERTARRAALVVGNEGSGLGAEMRNEVDALVAVPIAQRADSLNVAVAAGILLYLLTGER